MMHVLQKKTVNAMQIAMRALILLTGMSSFFCDHRWSRGHKARGQGQPFRGQTL